ncbi:Protein trichome birefringence-like 1 [Capsicum annuum]|nr:Protein trichome birefringence-like 1 [Capsicum annuum]KAF3666207.1 Protein trichome birefringence-like 1 [Capsicum annuum]
MADSPPSLPTTRKQSSFPPPPLQIRDNSPRMSELKKSLFPPSLSTPTSIRTSVFKTQKFMLFLAYVFTFLFVTCAIFFVFNNPSINHSFRKVLNRRSHLSTFFSHYFPSNHQNSTVYTLPFTPQKLNDSSITQNTIFPGERNGSENGLQSSMKNDHFSSNEGENAEVRHESSSKKEEEESQKVRKKHEEESKKVSKKEDEDSHKVRKRQEEEAQKIGKKEEEESQKVRKKEDSQKIRKRQEEEARKVRKKRDEDSRKLRKRQEEEAQKVSKKEEEDSQKVSKRREEESQKVNMLSNSKKNDTKNEAWWEVMSHCDVFDGMWVKDDANPLYEPGYCPFVDEPFDCYRNGRPDNGYEKFRWQPKHCNIPRFDAKDMLELLRGKRLVYVGDSLNRNMWESMVCLLRNSVEDKSRVFEVSGREDFKKEGAYSFIFADYNCSVEFVRSTFLVQEWEIPDGNGSTKETLRLDLVERSCDKYKGADVLVFNTGHWWTHEKTSEGKGYYQEGSHVYGELNVVEAFRKAMTTWARWIETNVDPVKTDVFFRGYSVSHFSGGEWYAGGKCDSDTEPLQDEKDLSPSLYPPIMGMLEDVIKWMKTPVYYLNVTIMSDFRKDGHPSVYRQPNMTDEERRTTLRYQDCSHWCLPGVPDTWNELLYAQILMKHYQKQQQQQQQIGS